MRVVATDLVAVESAGAVFVVRASFLRWDERGVAYMPGGATDDDLFDASLAVLDVGSRWALKRPCDVVAFRTRGTDAEEEG